MIRDARSSPAGGPALDPAGATATYARVASLPVVVERCELLPLVRDTTSGFTKVSIVVRLSGGGHTGEGEDITWDQIDQIELLRGGEQLGWLHGTRTFDELSALLGLANLFPVEPMRDGSRLYRRWAFESAALDLALRQSGLSLGEAVGRPARPVNFVASIRLGEPPSLLALRELLAVAPGLRFKLDPTPGWDEAVVEELARLGCVDVIDLKGRYRNVSVAMLPEAALYRRVIEGLPGAWIEDPAIDDDTAALLEQHRDRISCSTSPRCSTRTGRTTSPPRASTSSRRRPICLARRCRQSRIRPGSAGGPTTIGAASASRTSAGAAPSRIARWHPSVRC